jgi:hypothetical protein
MIYFLLPLALPTIAIIITQLTYGIPRQVREYELRSQPQQDIVRLYLASLQDRNLLMHQRPTPINPRSHQLGACGIIGKRTITSSILD